MPVAEMAGLQRRTFRAMGTLVGVISPAVGGEGFQEATRRTQETFERAEERFSRFRETSELSEVNRRAGHWTRVSPAFVTLLRMALAAARETEGLFDPTVLPALMAAGYDRNFDEIIAEARKVLHPPVPCGRWRDVQIGSDRILLPSGAALDLGGIAKGWAADEAVRAAASLLPWLLVDAGGDMRVTDGLANDGLDIGVEDPFDPTKEVLRLRLQTGAVATSSIARRSWGPNLHHVIDPRTGRSADTGVVQATAWAPTCSEAEVRATWALLAGRVTLDRIPVTIVFEDGVVMTSMQAGREVACSWR